MTIRVGLVGFGLSGRVFHAPLIAAIEQMALSKVVTSRQQEVNQRYPGVEVVDDIEALLADPDIDLVVITTPNHLHFQAAEAALQAGKHVLVEKPMTVTVAQADKLCQLAKAQQRTLAVYHNRRWDGDFLTLKRLLAEDKLGQLHRLELQYDRYRPNVRARWKEQQGEGGGVLYDLGAHLLDQSLQLLGWPDSVYASVRSLRQGAGAADDFLIQLHYPATEVILRSSSLATASGPRWLALGSTASFIKSGEDPQEARLAADWDPRQSGFGETDPAQHGVLTDADGNAHEVPTLPGQYLAFYQQLADAVNSGTRSTVSGPPVSGEEGAKVIRLIEAARLSSRDNRVVSV